MPPQTNPHPAPEGPLRQWHPARRRQLEEVLESSISSERTSRAAGTQVAQSGNLCHPADAPEIDGTVFVSGEGIEVGQMVPVEITARQDYHLLAEVSEGDDDE